MKVKLKVFYNLYYLDHLKKVNNIFFVSFLLQPNFPSKKQLIFKGPPPLQPLCKGPIKVNYHNFLQIIINFHNLIQIKMYKPTIYILIQKHNGHLDIQHINNRASVIKSEPTNGCNILNHYHHQLIYFFIYQIILFNHALFHFTIYQLIYFLY